jgi:hypothetical protein
VELGIPAYALKVTLGFRKSTLFATETADMLHRMYNF